MSDVPIIERPINSAIAVSNWLIAKNGDDPRELTPLKLQKILYFAQGWHLGYHSVPLFEDPIEAWKYGPVVSSVYFALKPRPRNEVIKEPIEGHFIDGDTYSLGFPTMKFPEGNNEKFMDSIWKTYSPKQPWELVSITHLKGSPWQQVFTAAGNREFDADPRWFAEYSNPIIPVELMMSYFKSFKNRRVNP
jgi:uncharacterized phage-associated protein